MNHACRNILRWALAAMAFVALASCGGGSDDAATQAIEQRITFNLPGASTFGDAPVALAATASSGLPVTFTSRTPLVCTVSGATLTLIGAGACTVSADQAGGGTSGFAAAVPVLNTLMVATAAQTITFVSPGRQTLGAGAVTLTATSTSGLSVRFTSSTPTVCTTTGTSVSLLSAGLCTVQASQPGDANYRAADLVSHTFDVEAGLQAQSIDYPSPGNQTLGMPPVSLMATATSGLPVTLTSMTPGVCTVDGTALTLVAAGDCTTVASQDGNAVFAAADVVTRTVTVAVASQAITFAGPGNQTLGTPPAALSATASSGLPVSFSSTTPAVCTVSGSTLTLVAAGSCSIDANQAGNASFSAAPTVTRSVTVAPAPLLAQTISFAGPGNQTLGTLPAALAATASSGLPVSFTSTTPAVCTVSGSTLTLVAAGSCSIDASQAGNGSFAAAPTVSRTFTVAAAAVAGLGNGGFEDAQTTVPSESGPVPAPDNNKAQGWISAASGYSRSTDRRSGAFSARLAAPASNSAVMLQNSIDHGGRPPLVQGASLTLRFWAKGTAGGTGNVLFALRYLDAVGNIRANSTNQRFETQINRTTWTQITFNLGPVPAGAVAAFVEFAQSIGPIGVGPAGEDWFAGEVFIDDVTLE